MSLVLGFDCEQAFALPGWTLPPSAQFAAQVRSATLRRDSLRGPLLADLSSQAGTILLTDVDGTPHITCRFLGAVTRSWPTNVVLMDVARIDGGAAVHMGFRARLTFEINQTVLPP